MIVDYCLYAITDTAKEGSLALAVEAALMGGATVIQYREKYLTGYEKKQEALRLQAVCKKYKVPLIINDDVELAKDIKAEGVHLGQSDMNPRKAREILGDEAIIGVTAKTVEQAKKAEEDGADYLGSGAVFGTKTKLDAVPLEHDKLDEICRSVSIPVVAIGGIDGENIEKLSGRCMNGFAVVGAIFGSEDIRKATVALKKRAMKVLNRKPTALTIAGSDSSGGAGIQADLKTMQANGVFGMSAITALTAQNTKGVTGIMAVDAPFLRQQLDAVFTDIFPQAVKIGMVSQEALIIEIADALQTYGAKNIVVDPVMVATSGAKLSEDSAVKAMQEKLFPLATLITPNIPEMEVLTGMKITSKKDMEVASMRAVQRYGCNVLCKGGHSICDADDFLCCANGEMHWFEGKRIDNDNTHGTGCTLSSAIASGLAKGLMLEDAILQAKSYISKALNEGMNLGQGSGPLWHGVLGFADEAGNGV